MASRAIGGFSVREKKANALDSFVRSESLKERTAVDKKISGLKALRLAKEAELAKGPEDEEKMKTKVQPQKYRRARLGL